jgi:MFS family permease
MIARAALPATIATLPRGEALAFLSLFFIPAVAQAILLTVVPLEALYLLDSPRAVTLLYVGTGLVAVAGRFSIPFLVRLLRRRFVFTLGTLSLAASSILLAFNQVPALAVGLVLITFAFACIEITSQLYVLDHVPRQALKHFEPIRIFAIAGPWTLGPWLGVYLQRSVAFVTPFAVAAIILLILFWLLRLGENAVLTSMRRPPPSPVRDLHRFFAQPRLRLAWTLAAARSSWWNMFHVYAPIFAVTSDLGAETGGIIASIGTGWIWLVPFWGWVGRRFGLRRLLQAGYAVAGVLTICAAVALGMPWLGAVLLVLAAFERSEMTTVFVSFRDAAQLGPPVVCSLLLSLFNLSAVFIARKSSRSMYLDLVQRVGLAQRMAGLQTIELTDSAAYLREGGQDAAVIDASERLIAAGADAVVVAGAAVAGIAHRLRAQLSVPLLDGIACAVGQTEALVRLGLHQRIAVAPLTSGSTATGLDPSLRQLLSR